MAPTKPPNLKLTSTFERLGTDFDDGEPPYTVAELQIRNLSYAMRSKDNWYNKVNDKEIVGKWMEEAKEQGLREEVIRFSISYVKNLAEHRDVIDISIVEGVYESDDLMGEEIRQNFADYVANAIEGVLNSESRDWHPNSNEQVLDLVHPSLYCLVYGVTRVTDRAKSIRPPRKRDFNTSCGSGTVIKSPAAKSDQKMFLSVKHQWLPSEFTVNPDGTVSIDSYINNLHPSQHAQLYEQIAKIFEKFIPMFEKVLQVLKDKPTAMIEADCSYRGDESDPDSDEDYEALEARELNRVIPQPDIPTEYVPPSDPKSAPIKLSGRRLQVIVKLANIHLTPENPKYEGGVWHIEGMKNEDIMSTGIFYYHVENITQSKLAFRQLAGFPVYEQDDRRFVKEVYGLEDLGESCQYLGESLVKQGRCLAFPNFYQHRVAPFELEDKSKPGFRKILAFFLVNPCSRILSTENVPPQQRDWLVNELGGPSYLGLPVLVTHKINSFIDWPMSLADAKKYRLDLMEERKSSIHEINEEFFEREYSLCEH